MATTTNKPEEHEHRLTILNLLVLILSAYVLLALVIQNLFTLRPEVERVLLLIDNIICVFFLFEFFVRFFHAENKLKFLKWRWIDFISSIPNVEFLRAGRALRLVRLLRILRAFRSTRHLVKHLFKNRTKGTFTTVAIMAVLLVIFSSIAILEFENVPNANIKTAEDAIWWSYITVTTVGYGGHFPVTSAGRILGMVLMTAGVGLFGTFTGFVSSWFVGANKSKDDEPKSTDKPFA